MLILCFFFQPTFAQNYNSASAKYQSVAEKIVGYNLEVKPGEHVLITGSPNEIALMEELQVAVSKAGGLAHLSITIPEANKRSMMAMPMAQLSQPRTMGAIFARNFDCFVNLNSTQNPALFKDVPEERFAAWRKGGLAEAEAHKKAHYRSVSLGQTGGIPTPAYAKSENANFDEMNVMFWKAVDADYTQMTRSGNRIAGLIVPGKKVKVTSKSGTNLTFKIGDSKPQLNTGKTSDNLKISGPANAWLPAGEVFACANPKSANGVIVVPSMRIRGEVIKNLKLTFANGRVTEMSADENLELIKESIDQSSKDVNVFSLFDVGLNPNSHKLANSDYTSWEMAGMVSLGIGNNSWAGGAVEADNSFFFHLAKASMKIDNVLVVDNGKLVSDMVSSK